MGRTMAKASSPLHLFRIFVLVPLLTVENYGKYIFSAIQLVSKEKTDSPQLSTAIGSGFLAVHCYSCRSSHSRDPT